MQSKNKSNASNKVTQNKSDKIEVEGNVVDVLKGGDYIVEPFCSAETSGGEW